MENKNEFICVTTQQIDTVFHISSCCISAAYRIQRPGAMEFRGPLLQKTYSNLVSDNNIRYKNAVGQEHLCSEN
jgi:hypothetical protein